MRKSETLAVALLKTADRATDLHPTLCVCDEEGVMSNSQG
jgi:hypothetical protein